MLHYHRLMRKPNVFTHHLILLRARFLARLPIGGFCVYITIAAWGSL